MHTPLRIARKRRSLTLAEVAASIGLDPGNLSRIERGEQVPAKETAEKLSRYFNGEVSEVQIIYPERFRCPASETQSSDTADAAPHLS